jgi:hypothetical protein
MAWNRACSRSAAASRGGWPLRDWRRARLRPWVCKERRAGRGPMPWGRPGQRPNRPPSRSLCRRRREVTPPTWTLTPPHSHVFQNVPGAPRHADTRQGWPADRGSGIEPAPLLSLHTGHAAAQASPSPMSRYLLRVPKRAIWPLCSRPAAPRVKSERLGHRPASRCCGGPPMPAQMYLHIHESGAARAPRFGAGAAWHSRA